MFGAWRQKLSGKRRRTASHCAFRRIRTSKRRCHDETSKSPCFYTISVGIGMCLVRGDPSWVGCGGGVARIEYLAKWALENAMSRRHLEDSLFLHNRRRDSYVFGAWRPQLSGMRWWDGSHCVFRQMGPRKRDVTTAPRRHPVFTRSPSRLVCV